MQPVFCFLFFVETRFIKTACNPRHVVQSERPYSVIPGKIPAQGRDDGRGGPDDGKGGPQIGRGEPVIGGWKEYETTTIME